MKINLLSTLILALLTLQACQQDGRPSSETDTARVNTEKESPTKLIEILVGEWQRDASGATSVDARVLPRLIE